MPDVFKPLAPQSITAVDALRLLALNQQPQQYNLDGILRQYGDYKRYSSFCDTENGSVTMYTVPANKVIFILAATISTSNEDTVENAEGWLCYDNAGVGANNATAALRIIVSYDAAGNVYQSGSTSQSYSIPFLMRQGDRIIIYNELLRSRTVASVTFIEIDLERVKGYITPT